MLLFSPISPTTDVPAPDEEHLAFWWDYALDVVYLYEQVLTGRVHLGQSVVALEQGLDVNIAPLVFDETLREALLHAGSLKTVFSAWWPAGARRHRLTGRTLAPSTA